MNFTHFYECLPILVTQQVLFHGVVFPLGCFRRCFHFLRDDARVRCFTSLVGISLPLLRLMQHESNANGRWVIFFFCDTYFQWLIPSPCTAGDISENVRSRIWPLLLSATLLVQNWIKKRDACVHRFYSTLKNTRR